MQRFKESKLLYHWIRPLQQNVCLSPFSLLLSSKFLDHEWVMNGGFSFLLKIKKFVQTNNKIKGLASFYRKSYAINEIVHLEK